MYRRIFSFLQFVIVSIFGLSAQIVTETLELVDGSVLHGYVSTQSPSEGIHFHAAWTTIVIPGSCVMSQTEMRIPYASLPTEWREWIDANNAPLGRDNEFLLYSLSFDKDTVAVDSVESSHLPAVLKMQNTAPMVRVLERGENVRFVDLAARDYQFGWDDVREIRYNNADRLLLSGIETVLTLADNRQVRGRISKQVPGELMCLLTDDGIVETCSVSDIVSLRKEPLNAYQSLIQQTPLCDVLSLQGGSSVSGFISNQEFCKDGTKIYLTLEDGSVREFDYEQIEKISHQPNSLYQPLHDVVLNDNQMMVEQMTVSFASVNSRNGLLFSTDRPQVSLSLAQLLEHSFFFYVKENEVQNYKLMKLSQQTTERAKGKNSIIPVGFSFEDYAMNAIAPHLEFVSNSGNHTMRFYVSKPGTYMLYHAKQRQGIIIDVTE